ncbi:hypothetical protein ACFYTQ_37015 [Nocardia sp. NPDC004068]|uniref:hypothetical protein n=1 Tax=Nocardia sp. NPDC004068 TaxID=3364303 RepID=UPI0036A3CDBB
MPAGSRGDRAAAEAVGRDSVVLARVLGARVTEPSTVVVVDEVTYVAVALVERSADVTALFPAHYPEMPPLVFLTPRPGAIGFLADVAARLCAGAAEPPASVALPLPWNLSVDPEFRLSNALGRSLQKKSRSGNDPESELTRYRAETIMGGISEACRENRG